MSKRQQMEQIIRFRLTDSMYRQLERMAETDRRRISDFVRLILEDYLRLQTGTQISDLPMFRSRCGPVVKDKISTF